MLRRATYDLTGLPPTPEEYDAFERDKAPEAFDKAAAVLYAIAENVYRLGDKPGQGSRVKMINQLLAGVHLAAAAEAMALGTRMGCDPHALYDALSHSAGCR